MFPPPSSILPSINDPVVEMWTKPLSEFNMKYSRDNDSFSIDVDPFGKSTTRLSQTFMKTLIILTVNKYFGGNFCTPVLFNDAMRRLKKSSYM